jgi:hypothetical protein
LYRYRDSSSYKRIFQIINTNIANYFLFSNFPPAYAGRQALASFFLTVCFATYKKGLPAGQAGIHPAI